MNPIVRAIDLGYGNTKYTKGKNSISGISCDMFPSIAPFQSNNNLSSGVFGSIDTKNVIVNNTVYEVGPDANSVVDVHYAHPLHSTYCQTDQYIALQYGALAYMGCTHIDILVAGLPLNLLNSHKKELTEKFQGEIKINNELTINVDKVVVVGQPMGGYVNFVQQNALANASGFKNTKSLVIDPGYYTFDWMVMKGYTPIIERCGAENGGMSSLLDRIANEISKDKNINPDLIPYTNIKAIDEGIQSGKFMMYGKSVSLMPYILKSSKYMRSVFDTMVNKINGYDDIQNIILVGGAANFFKSAAQKYFKHHEVKLMPNSIYANVKGFHIMGEATAQSLKGEVA